jgi:hypothetical protein
MVWRRYQPVLSMRGPASIPGLGVIVLPTERPGVAWAATRHQVVAEALDRATATLLAEFAGRLPAKVILDQLDYARQQSLAAGVRAGLSSATESLAHVRLCALSAQGHAEIRYPRGEGDAVTARGARRRRPGSRTVPRRVEPVRNGACGARR